MIAALKRLFSRPKKITQAIYCKRCKKILGSAVSIKRGYGSKCWKHEDSYRKEMANNLKLFGEDDNAQT